MITIEGPEGTERNDLATVASGGIAKPAQAGLPLTVGLLEKALLERFPCSDAETWDRMGRLVGDPSQPVKGVCVALDVTLAAIRTTASCGANVLITHHPAFLNAPSAISPSRDIATSPGVNVWEAVRSGVALMNFHTALDVSEDARNLFMGLLKFDFQRMVVPADAGEGKGYGYLCAVRAQDAPLSLAQLAARCTSVFGRTPRVWGDGRDVVTSVVFANGSAGNVVEACLANQADCLVCGELGYHLALDASQAGLSIIELGHDASELPLTAVLAEAAVESGVAADAVRVIDQAGNWSCHDSTRL